MLRLNPRKSKVVKVGRFLLVFVLIAGWIFSGWPQVLDFYFNGEYLKFPSEIKQAKADVEIRRPTAHTDSLSTTNPTNAYDAETGITFSTTLYNTDSDPSITFHTWQGTSYSYTNTYLKVRYHADAGTNDTYAIAYSTTGCSGTFTNLAGPTSAGITDTTVSSVDIGASPNLSQFCVKIATDKVAGPDNKSVYIRDIWAEGTYTPTTTLATGSDPAANTIAPGAAATDVDLFTLQTDASTEAITSVTVNLSTNIGVGLLAITDNANTVLGSTASPATGSNAITVTGLSATTTITTFKIRVTPLAHSTMPAPGGGAYSITAPITSWVGPNIHTGSDTNPNALTIDNLSPAGTTGASATPGDGQVDVGWTPPGDSDFQQIYIYCKTSSMISGEAPTEGTDPTVDGVACDGTARMKYKGAASPQTISSLTNDTLYYFRIYARDNNGNFTAYASTQEVSATPVAGLSTTILIRNVADTADVSTITFPAGDPSAIISNPTGNGDVQVLTATASEATPVAILKSATAYKLWYNVTSVSGWGDAVASEKLYVIAIDGALDLATFGTSAYNMTVWGTDQATTTQELAAGVDEELFLQVTLSALWGKTGTSTLSVLGEAL